MAAGFYFGLHYFKAARLLEDTPTSRVRSASQGFVSLFGYAKKAAEQPLLKSPLSHTDCIWFQFKIEHRQGHGRNNHWQIVEKGESKNLFLLDDRGDECVIHAKKAEITTVYNRTWDGSKRWPLGEPHSDIYQKEAILNKRFDLAISFAGDLTKRMGHFVDILNLGKYRYTESLIREGEPLYILGYFSSLDELDHLKGRKQKHRELLKEWKKDPKIMQKIDTNNDGQVDVNEWQKAVKLAEDVAEKKYEAQLKDTIIHHIQKPKDSALPFIISSKDQHDLISRYKWYAVLGIISFFAGGSFLTWFIFMR